MKSWLLLAALVLSSPGCKTASEKPSTLPTPLVSCEQPATDDVDSPPVSSLEQWVEKGPAWAVDVLAILTLERKYRVTEQNCYKDSQK